MTKKGLRLKVGDQQRLKSCLQKRRNTNRTPDAVDDAGDAGKEFDCDTERSRSTSGEFSEKKRDHEPYGNRVSIAMKDVTKVP